MFGFLMDQERIKERLLGFEDGERRLTNVLHLAELLHQAGAEGRLGMAALVRWLALQREPSTPGRDEHLLRLESDAHAVQIATIHKSKGLEYRVVFCPYAWSGSTVGGGEVFFHDPSAGFRLTIDLNAPDQGASRAAAENELLSENLRLLYVALTRARERCYLVWGNIRAAETSAMAYLFHGADLPAPAAAADGASVPRLLLESIRSKTEEDLAADLQRLVQRSRGSIETRPLPEAAEVPAQQIASRAPDQLFSRRFCGSIDRSWRTASYSRLVAAADFDADLPDRDSPLLSASPAGPPEEGPSPEASRRDRFSFPTGSRAGNFFHSVLEAVDFRNPPHPDNKAVIEQKLAEFGYEEAWRETVLRIVAEIAAAALFPGAPGLTLSRLNPGERIHEMEFYHPLRLITPETLRDAFEPCGLRDALAGFPERLGRLVFSPTRGFMKGYIDMVAGHAGRFFLVDWKSNHLGDRPEDYHAGRLLPPMQDGYYILQYHLYCLALHLYLGRRLPDYDYRRHFGGVAYVFIRGVDGSRGPDYGIYRDRPEPDIIHALGKALLPCYE
jgi:exodeoxyribonuclease V beta subunit